MIGQNDYVIERIPWELLGWHEMEVRRSPTWWSSLQPRLDEFWTDVHKAQKGEFVLPAPSGSRASKTKVVEENGADDICKIQLSGLCV